MDLLVVALPTVDRHHVDAIGLRHHAEHALPLLLDAERDLRILLVVRRRDEAQIDVGVLDERQIGVAVGVRRGDVDPEQLGVGELLLGLRDRPRNERGGVDGLRIVAGRRRDRVIRDPTIGGFGSRDVVSVCIAVDDFLAAAVSSSPSACIAFARSSGGTFAIARMWACSVGRS